MNLEKFKEQWLELATSPQGAVKMYIIAVLETVKEKNKEGLKMIGICLPKPELNNRKEPGKRHRFYLEQFSRHIKGTDFPGAIAGSYLGGTPENGYSYSYDNSIELVESRLDDENKAGKIFVQSGGKDMASPVHVKKNKDGYWKLFNVSSLCTGVKHIESDDF